MPQLHSDIMFLLVKYFDAQTWAKLAQVCTTWKKIAYRPSVWQNLEWRPKEAHRHLFLAKHEIPCNARHVGEPTKLCFLGWAQTIHISRIHNNLPRQILTEADPVKKMAALHRIWQKTKPCIHTGHHIWTDVFKGRAFLHDLTQAEVERLYYRLVEQHTSGTNAYHVYIDNRVAEAIQPLQGIEDPPPIQSEDMLCMFEECFKDPILYEGL